MGRNVSRVRTKFEFFRKKKWYILSNREKTWTKYSFFITIFIVSHWTSVFNTKFYSTFVKRVLNLIPSLFVITVSRMRETSWFLPRSTRDFVAGSYFKFAGDLQESSSRGKSWGFRMLSDRSPRSIQKIVTLRNRATLDPRQCKILLSLSFFSSPSPLLILLSSFYSLSFSRCVRFADHR